MDRIIRITLCIFFIVLVAFVAPVLYTGYVGNAYRSSLVGTYTYSCAISTDADLTNVTLFIPVPSNPRGNSPVIARYSSHEIAGIPTSWTTELYDTGKGVLVKVSTPHVSVPAGTTPQKPYTVTISANISSGAPIDTRDPVASSALFRPVQGLSVISCPDTAAPGGRCSAYASSVFARYESSPESSVHISSGLSGTESWNIFGPESGTYLTAFDVTLTGAQDNWTPIRVSLEDSIGAAPPRIPS